MTAKTVWGRSWLVALIGGTVLLALSALFLFQPLIVEVSVVWVVGFFWFITGITKLIGLFFEASHWGWKLPSALLSILVGAWIVFPDSHAQQLLNTYAVFDAIALSWGVLGILSGATALAAALRARSWPEAFFPACEILIAAYLITNIFTAALAIPYLYAFLTALSGIALIAAALKARL